MTLLLSSSSLEDDISDDPFSYVPLGVGSKSKKRVNKSVVSHRKDRKRICPSVPSVPEKQETSSRCSGCGMPWTCLKTFETIQMHKGFCSERLSTKEDRELVPECEEGRHCRSKYQLHYELRRHEHFSWSETESKSPFTPPPPPGQSPLAIPSSKRKRQARKLFSEMEKPLFKDFDSSFNPPSMAQVASEEEEEASLRLASTAPSNNALERLDTPEQEPNLSEKLVDDFLTSERERLHSRRLSEDLVNDYIQGQTSRYTNEVSSLMHSKPMNTSDERVVVEETVDINDSFLNQTIYREFFEEEIQLNKEKTMTEKSRQNLSNKKSDDQADEGLIEEDNILTEQSVNDIPMERNSNHDLFEEDIQFIQEYTDTESNRRDNNNQPCVDAIQSNRGISIEDVPEKNLRSGVVVTAKSLLHDGGIHVSLKVTDPDLKLEGLEMKIPKARGPATKQSTINRFFGGSEPRPVLSSPKKKEEFRSSYSKPTHCPFYRRIARTSFVVDAFNYGYIPGVSIYFLSHFHRDHYIGLTRSFSKPIVCSQITASLLRMQLNVSDTYIRAMDLNMERTVDGSGVSVTLLEANHCPGAVMFLFKFLDGTATLHTGDFRAIPAMEEYPSLWDTRIKSLHLDTTYCSPEHDFPAQDYVIRKTVDIVKQRLKKDHNTLVLVGTYTIGKERIFMAIAEELDRKIFPQAAQKARILDVLEDDVIAKRLVRNRKSRDKSYIHIVSVKDARSVEFLRTYRNKFKCSSVLSVVPTGWTRESASFKVNQREAGIYCMEVPYSEHSSYSELKRFVQFINLNSADAVIPTVNVGSYNSRTRLKKTFQSWIEKDKNCDYVL